MNGRSWQKLSGYVAADAACAGLAEVADCEADAPIADGARITGIAASTTTSLFIVPPEGANE